MGNAQRGPFQKKRLGDFEIGCEIGRGGMGIVYEARQVSLNRKVALKVLGTSLGMTSKAVVRFRREPDRAAEYCVMVPAPTLPALPAQTGDRQEP